MSDESRTVIYVNFRMGDDTPGARKHDLRAQPIFMERRVTGVIAEREATSCKAAFRKVNPTVSHPRSGLERGAGLDL